MLIHISAFSVFSVMKWFLIRIKSKRKEEHTISFLWIMHTVPALDWSSCLKKWDFSRKKEKLNALGASSIQIYTFLKADKVLFSWTQRNQTVWGISLAHTSNWQIISLLLSGLHAWLLLCLCMFSASLSLPCQAFVSTQFTFLSGQALPFAFWVMTCFSGLICRLLQFHKWL